MFIYIDINRPPTLILGPHLILVPRVGSGPGGTRAGRDPGQWDPGRAGTQAMWDPGQWDPGPVGPGPGGTRGSDDYLVV